MELYDFKVLLRRASEAVGYEKLPIEGWTLDPRLGMRIVDLNSSFVRYWNPLQNTDAAFELARHLNIVVLVDPVFTQTTATRGYGSWIISHAEDINQATRLAIVQAAANWNTNDT